MTELVEANGPNVPLRTPVSTPATLLERAIEKDLSMEKLEKLMDLQERWEKNEAKKAYGVAISAFKANPPDVVNDMLNKQYGSMYSSISNLVNTVNPELGKHGLSARWDITQEDKIKVTCILSHVSGYSESVSMEGPPDDSGKKNLLQQIKSTTTYLKGATFEAITGISSRTMNIDDDGNGAETEYISEEQHNELDSLIKENLSTDTAYLPWLLKYLKVESLDKLPAPEFRKAKIAINERIKKLHGRGGDT
jgi:hypothetical protein